MFLTAKIDKRIKKTLMVCVVLLLTALSCKDKEPEPLINQNPLVGTWVSTDSVKVGSNNVYNHDTLIFSLDLLDDDPRVVPFAPYLKMYGTRNVYYQWSISYPNILNLDYKKTDFSLVIKTFENRFIINNKLDTLSISGFKQTLPHSHFEDFYKIK